MSDRFFNEGIAVFPVGPPAVRAKEPILRISLSAKHTRRQLDYFVKVALKFREQFGVGKITAP